jgi:multiple sugar transport system permease protein
MSLDTIRAPKETAAAPVVADWRVRSQQVLGRDWQIAYLFVAPMMALLVGLIAWPFLQAFYMSFFNVIGPRWGAFRGLDNYIDQWTDPIFQASFAVTVRYTFFAVALKFVVGLCAAMLLHNIKHTLFRVVITPLMLLPFVLPEVVAALTWRFLFDPVFGGLNGVLRVLYDATGGALGSDKGWPWISDPNWAFWSLVAVNLWRGLPFFILLTLAGLKSIDSELYDAASVDGANAWQRFLHITLPGLRYVIIVETLLSTISTFNAFGMIYLITGGGPLQSTRVYAILAYEKIGGLRYSQGVAVALTMAPILLIAIMILGRYMRAGQKGDYGTDSAAWRALMFVAWPLRFVIGLLVKLFWLINDSVEAAFRALGRRTNAYLAAGGHERETRYYRIMRRLGQVVLVIGTATILLFELFPFYWVFITAFKEPHQIRDFRSIFWPDPWSLVNFNELLFTRFDFFLWLRNTLQVALVSTLIGLLVSSLGAYALVRLRWRGAGFISSAILITYLMPGIMMVVPLFQVFAFFNLTNSLASLMIAYPTFLMPFAAWLLMGYYRSIPEELEDAALIDGANRFQAFYRIVLPLTAPALAAVAILAIVNSWNEFLFAFIFITKNEATTLPIGLARMIHGDLFPWGPMMAASVLMALPVMILWMMAQRFLVEGLTAGSVKG